MVTGKCTMISRAGVLSSFQRPSSRLSLRAAKSNRALCASHGLISWSKVTAGLTVGIPLSHLLPAGAMNRFGSAPTFSDAAGIRPGLPSASPDRLFEDSRDLSQGEDRREPKPL